MKCPHCTVEFHGTTQATGVPAKDREIKEFQIYFDRCPRCERAILLALLTPKDDTVEPVLTMIFPTTPARALLPPEVPQDFVGDYREACAVLPVSAKASAALSRRSLQYLLREAGKTTKRDLADQIDETIPKVPSYVGDMLHGVRVIGNFAAHPLKSTNTGEIIDVEPGEAEMVLDTIETVFDHYFVQPERTKQKRAAINAKLAEAGKPPLK